MSKNHFQYGSEQEPNQIVSDIKKTNYILDKFQKLSYHC